MRLYVFCHNPRCRSKIYLRSSATVRSQILQSFQLRCPFCGHTDNFYNTEVTAEMTAVTGAGGAIAGGVIGLLIGGPIGGLVGALGGGTIGVGLEQSDRTAVERFNQS